MRGHGHRFGWILPGTRSTRPSLAATDARVAAVAATAARVAAPALAVATFAALALAVVTFAAFSAAIAATTATTATCLRRRPDPVHHHRVRDAPAVGEKIPLELLRLDVGCYW